MQFPVEAKIPEIKRALAANRSVVLSAPPGSGKTTAVPPALLDEPWLAGRKILMLEPRRLAARSSADYIARQLGEAPGATVGYQVRLERKVSAATRLEIVTEGLLAQRILSDGELSEVGLVIFDEFHERSLACDLSFALALEIRRALREDLRLMVMSATLDAGEVAAHLGDATIVSAEGRMHPVETKYLGDVPLSSAVCRALRETVGDVLCFLPGEGEIRRAREMLCAALAGGEFADVELLPLYGSLPASEQDRVFARDGRRKVILSTSIAETSLTIPGISAVVDSGLMRINRFTPSTAMSSLVTVPLSLDRAEQRRGRAGRVAAGVCYRLWDEGENRFRPPKMRAEILDADLCSLVMTSSAWGALHRDDLPWLTPPPASAWEQASKLLELLCAIDASGRLTEKGLRMAKLAMHPRLANMCLEACRLGGSKALAAATVLSAIVEEGSKSRQTDIRKVYDEVLSTPNRPFSRRVLELARRFERQLERHCAKGAGDALGEGALLALSYPDRVAKNRGNGSFRMVSGRGASIESGDPLSKSPFLVCCELDDRAGDAKVFLACPIEAGEIERLFAAQIVEEPFCEWDRRQERVKCVVCRRIGEMTLSERNDFAAGQRDKIAAALVEGIRVKGVWNLPSWDRHARQLAARVAFLHRRLGWPALTDETILKALEGFVGGMNSWKDLERVDLAAVIDSVLLAAGHNRRELDRLAPERMEVPSGSHMLIHYEGDEPTCEVRLQECFGMMSTPKVADGTVPVVMTLLSPAQRPIQVTKDLSGFWKGAYQIVRKDMRGRYPKHYWPEDPLTAVATRRVRPS